MWNWISNLREEGKHFDILFIPYNFFIKRERERERERDNKEREEREEREEQTYILTHFNNIKLKFLAVQILINSL